MSQAKRGVSKSEFMLLNTSLQRSSSMRRGTFIDHFPSTKAEYVFL